MQSVGHISTAQRRHPDPGPQGLHLGPVTKNGTGVRFQSWNIVFVHLSGIGKYFHSGVARTG